jgi:hypothetical protein
MTEASKYNFPKAKKVQVFEQVDTYIETQHNYTPDHQKSAAEQQLQSIVSKLRQKYPDATDEQLFQRLIEGFEAMPRQNPQNWQRWQDIFSLLFAGGIEATKVLVPVAGIPIEVSRRLYEIYARDRKELPGN